VEFWTPFGLGLVGSLHCAGMCGPLALALPATGASMPGYIAGRLAYNLGRMMTYSVLGLVFGAIGKTLLLAGIQRGMSIALGIALLIGLSASRKLAVWQPVTGFVQQLKSGMSPLLRRRSFTGLTLLGALNGLLPCGLVYVAGAGATATGGVLPGMMYMAAFGAGTVPMMLAIGISGKLIPLPLRLKLARAIPLSVFLLAVLLILRGMSLNIPYVSPELTSGGAPRCH